MARCITIAALTLGSVAPTAMMGTADAAGWRAHECRYQTLDGHLGFSDKEVKRTIRCAFDRWAPGNVEEALCVAARESGYDEFADNPYSTAAGVFQFVAGTWSGVHDRYHTWWHRHGLKHSVYNARANVEAAARYVSDVGWAPWAGGC